jgi:hypothetical protein
MDINLKFQKKHDQNPNNEWELIRHLERDICFFYHQLSSYSFIIGDLDFAEYYNLPYWNYINRDFRLTENELCFIKNGCLVLILAMALEQIDDAGCYIDDKIDIILDNLKQFEPQDEKQNELHDIVTLALNSIKHQNRELYDLLKNKSIWVHEEFVRGYFRELVNEFDSNPYFNK